MAKKWVYLFSEGSADMRDLLGGKGAGCAEMTRAELPVPPGFTITTEACNAYYEQGEKFPEGMWEQATDALRQVEKQTAKKLGDAANPLLVSVRSGAKFSMPGMMDTVLNLGLNPDTVQGLAKLTHNPRFAYDAYRRFIQMFGKIVLDLDPEPFEQELEAAKKRSGAPSDADLKPDALQALVETFKGIVKKETGNDFPNDPNEQLEQAVGAVFRSWNNSRAIAYRNNEHIPHTLGTAVNVQTMVFGNMGNDSGTGVAFTRNPSTGEKSLYGEYLLNAQGEDVVAGIRTPQAISALERDLPGVYQQFKDIAQRLEQHYRDVQDMEFTIERGKLFMLQTRSGKRGADAAVKIAVDMVHEGVISKQEAVLRVEASQVDQLLHTRLDPNVKYEVVARGTNAAPGAATGQAVFTAETAEEWGKAGKRVILVRPKTDPEDYQGMIASQGILTSTGGATSHAAVVARGVGKPCVVGAEAVHVDEARKQFTAGSVTVSEGDMITINGTTGEVILGEVQMIPPEISSHLGELLSWADETRRLGVMANADYPRDSEKARELGAEGIGLCRTEHMFMEAERLPIVQQMILAKDKATREASLAKLLEFQRQDFLGILRVMHGLPVTIRLIDPPLHEFLPSYEELLVETTTLRCTGKDPALLKEREALLDEVAQMREANPMLGLRGCRLGILFPDITEMQVRAIFEAACILQKDGVEVHPEIMIPLVGHVNELRIERETLEHVAKTVMDEQGVKVDYKFGTMIEIPRACLVANQIAEYAEFFSFGTNDLTQMGFGFSRDDAEGKFLFKYVEDGILPVNPFQTLDRDGIGELMRIAIERAHKTRPDIKLGICGEHGGDPASVELCHELGLTYVSCSPYRVPVARLAAAQAALTKSEKDR
ncbi:MAG TPA: pyruvate, phosphate dikinase [Chloroflexota bacterium]|nr:pyruvate, phosphate dikinase [Chloroflexota bacterium]